MDSTNYIEVVKYHRDDVLFREGDDGGCMYLVESGAVGIIARYGTPKAKLLAELRAGDFFGEMGMVRGFPRSATAIILEADTCLSAITWDTLGSYIVRAPAKIVMLMQQLSNRIAETNDMYLSACNAVTELIEDRDRLAEEIVTLKNMLPNPDAEIKPLSMVQKKAVDEALKKMDSKYKNYINGYTGHSYSRFARK